MTHAPVFSVERKQRLLDLLIEALESDLPRLEEALLEVETRPVPAPVTPRAIDEEPNLRLALSDLKENLRTLRASVLPVPDAHPAQVEVFSVVQTRQDARDTWYFITPCEHYFERELLFDGLRIHARARMHFLMGVPRGHTYGTGGSWNTHTEEVYEEPVEHRVIGIF